jgi:hypothetical protein
MRRMEPLADREHLGEDREQHELVSEQGEKACHQHGVDVEPYAADAQRTGYQ